MIWLEGCQQPINTSLGKTRKSSKQGKKLTSLESL